MGHETWTVDGLVEDFFWYRGGHNVLATTAGHLLTLINPFAKVSRNVVNDGAGLGALEVFEGTATALRTALGLFWRNRSSKDVLDAKERLGVC
jgi:hypothetical protein